MKISFQALGACAATATLLGGGSALAQTTPLAIYGTVDLAIGSLESQPPGPPNAPITRVRGVHNGAMQTSYFGLRGTEDLGGGLKARFQLESFMQVDTGQSGRFNTPTTNDSFWSRSAWVGLEGGFGEVRLGNNTNPAWLANVFTSAMGSNSIFSPSFRQQYNGSTRGSMALDTALPNSISYSTPRLGGAVATLAVQARENRGTGANIVANVVYRGGPMLLALALGKTEHLPPPDPDAPVEEDFVMLGGSYDFKVVRLFGQYTHYKDNAADLTIKTPHLGLTAPVGADGEVQLAWARAKHSGANTSTRTTTSAGYVHRLSRRTNLYAMFANDKLPVGTATSYALGIRHTY